VAGRIRRIDLQFKEFRDGINTADPRVAVGNRYLGKDQYDLRNGWKQAVDAVDIMLHLKKPRPGNIGFCDGLTAPLRGLGIYQKSDGTETLLAVAGGKLYSVNTENGGLTELYDLGGNGEAWFQSYYDKCYVCNGSGVCVVEGTAARRLTLVPPSGVTAAAVSGGSLPDGTYKIYVSYSIGQDYFSKGQAVAEVTCGSGNNTIRLSNFAKSADPQVTKKTVWMTDAGGAVWYYYGSADNDDNTTIDIDSNAARNVNLVYTVEAAYNDNVSRFDYIKAFNNYLYGASGKTLYRSLQAGNAYDLRRFSTGATGNKAEYPYKIEGIFGIGADLYLNTAGGLIRIPGGDYNAQIDIRQGRFDYPRTVVEWNQGLLGWTTKGLRFFDGERMYPIDISREITTINTIINGNARAGSMPAACVVRDNERLEYHLGYNGGGKSSTANESELVLNLDTLYFMSENTAHAAFERWTRGFNYMVVKSDDTYYCGQSNATKSVVYRKDATQNVDSGLYYEGALREKREYGWSLQTPTILPSLTGMLRCLTMRIQATLNKTLYVEVVIDKMPRIVRTHTRTGSYDSRFGIARFGLSYFTTESPVDKKTALEANLKGKSVYVRFYQKEADRLFQLIDAILTCSLKETRYT